jgi:hypothetical protein
MADSTSPAGGEEPKKEEAEAPKEEPVKAKPVDYHTVKAGWVQRRGALGFSSDWVDATAEPLLQDTPEIWPPLY